MVSIALALIGILLIVASCVIYSFTGQSDQLIVFLLISALGTLMLCPQCLHLIKNGHSRVLIIVSLILMMINCFLYVLIHYDMAILFMVNLPVPIILSFVFEGKIPKIKRTMR